jgi:hypothetical protein
MPESKIYAIEVDWVLAVEPSGYAASLGGNAFDIYPNLDNQSDTEMIEEGFIRVSHPDLNGMETFWAERWEINKGRELLGEDPIL